MAVLETIGDLVPSKKIEVDTHWSSVEEILKLAREMAKLGSPDKFTRAILDKGLNTDLHVHERVTRHKLRKVLITIRDYNEVIQFVKYARDQGVLDPVVAEYSLRALYEGLNRDIRVPDRSIYVVIGFFIWAFLSIQMSLYMISTPREDLPDVLQHVPGTQKLHDFLTGEISP